MAKKETQNKDLQIENEIIRGAAGDAKLSFIQIPCDNKTNKLLRVLNEINQPFFNKSSRAGNLVVTDNGYRTDVTGFEKEISGKRYEVVEVSNKEVVLKGKILAKAAAAENVVNINTDKKVGNL
ncbi:MAG TPA: hypothetical protein PLT92_13720 [Ignavibacteriaceae bacterium]|nr:hypothetical protein [Ignavibacteriaceae bacterium]